MAVKFGLSCVATATVLPRTDHVHGRGVADGARDELSMKAAG